MSTHDDENIEFDFFDEPETVEATQRRRLPRLDRGGGRGGGERPPRPPMRAPTGLVPLARLVGLIAIAIVIVIGLVFWVGSCQGASKKSEYAAYADKVRAIATADRALGKEFENAFTSSTKQSDFENKLQQFAQQEQQAYVQAQQIRAPGPVRAIHQNLIDAIELRYKGLTGLGDTLASSTKSQTVTIAKLANAGQLLTASDVVWDQLYRIPATQQLKDQGVTGVVIPASRFLSNSDFVSARSFSVLLGTTFGGASTGGTPSGKHGDALISVRALPDGIDLSTSTATTIKVTTALSLVATVENSGNFQEPNVVVNLTIKAGGKPITKQEKIALIQPAQRQTVTFTGISQELPTTAYGNPATIKIEVAPVAGEVFTTNNSATYTVLFTLP
jgi:hypothetical protein